MNLRIARWMMGVVLFFMAGAYMPTRADAQVVIRVGHRHHYRHHHYYHHHHPYRR